MPVHVDVRATAANRGADEDFAPFSSAKDIDFLVQVRTGSRLVSPPSGFDGVASIDGWQEVLHSCSAQPLIVRLQPSSSHFLYKT